MRRFVANVLSAAVLCAVTVRSEPIGLVLSGGGAKGAYEVGVWQVLEETGISSNVTAISGTSVGAINAALFATRPEAAESLWLEHMEKAFTLNTNRIYRGVRKADERFSEAFIRFWETKQEEPPRLFDGFRFFGGVTGALFEEFGSNLLVEAMADAPSEGFVDSSPLTAAISGSLPAIWPGGTPAVYATALEKGTGTESITWKLNEEPHERRVGMILASAAFPLVFPSVAIDSTNRIDGGWEDKGGVNVPLEPILENHSEIKTVIVVYLAGEAHLRRDRREKNRLAAASTGVRLVEIVPSENIGGLFGCLGVVDASPETAKHLIELGRKDARKVLVEAGLMKQ